MLVRQHLALHHPDLRPVLQLRHERVHPLVRHLSASYSSDPAGYRARCCARRPVMCADPPATGATVPNSDGSATATGDVTESRSAPSSTNTCVPAAVVHQKSCSAYLATMSACLPRQHLLHGVRVVVGDVLHEVFDALARRLHHQPEFQVADPDV